MNTPVLTLQELIRMMRDLASRAANPHDRYSGETDAVLLGKILAVELIGERFLSGRDPQDLAHEQANARDELTRAMDAMEPVISSLSH